MKTISVLIVSVLMVAIFFTANAQQSTSKVGNKPASVPTEITPTPKVYVSPAGSGSVIPPLELEGIVGEIYIGSDWPKGNVTLRNGSNIDTYCLRYNILDDQMQFISGSDTLAFASPQEINSLSFNGHTFIYEAFQCENTIRKGYFEIIEPGKNKLLLKRIVTSVLDETPDQPGFKKYFIDECYFISKNGLPASKLLCTKKSVLTAFNDHSSEMEEYMKVSGNKAKTSDDLKKLVSYYNSLE